MVIPKRIALCYDENAIIVEYGYKDKLYHYKIQLTKAMAELQMDQLVDVLTKEHEQFIGKDVMDREQVIRLVEKLKLQWKKQRQMEALPSNDYNHVSETQLKLAKSKMSAVFNENVIAPGQEGYVYDKQVEFEEGDEESGWDE